MGRIHFESATITIKSALLTVHEKRTMVKLGEVPSFWQQKTYSVFIRPSPISLSLFISLFISVPLFCYLSQISQWQWHQIVSTPTPPAPTPPRLLPKIFASILHLGSQFLGTKFCIPLIFAGLSKHLPVFLLGTENVMGWWVTKS